MSNVLGEVPALCGVKEVVPLKMGNKEVSKHSVREKSTQNAATSAEASREQTEQTEKIEKVNWINMDEMVCGYKKTVVFIENIV